MPIYIEASITIEIIAIVEAATSFFESQVTFFNSSYDSKINVFIV